MAEEEETQMNPAIAYSLGQIEDGNRAQPVQLKDNHDQGESDASVDSSVELRNEEFVATVGRVLEGRHGGSRGSGAGGI